MSLSGLKNGNPHLRTANYASPSSGYAHSNRQLTPSFELKFFVCRHVSMWGFQNPVCLSVPREMKSLWLRQYQSYISNNWYINGKVFTSTTALKPKNLIFFSKKFEIVFWLVFWLVPKSWNQHSSRSQHAPIWRHRGYIVVPLRVDI